MSRNIQSYPDGMVRIYAVENTGAPGDAPKPRLTLKAALRYEERTVGVTRHYAAKQADERVDAVLRCPRYPVSNHDVAIPNDGEQYRVTLIQNVRDVEPPSMDLTLQRLERNYETA